MENEFVEKYVRKELRKCQLKQLSILEEVDKICRNNGINYWLDGGTLLGAVRHDGFIPWDDDIDIAMTLDDMNKFIRIAPKELSKNLFLQTPESDPTSKEPIIKIRDLNSIYIEPSDKFNAPYQKGLYIDIFPFIDYPSVSKGFVKRITKGISTSYSILHSQHYYSLRAFMEFFYFSLKYYSYKAIWKIANMVCSKGVYISNILVNNGYGIMHRRDSIFPLSTITFEGKEFMAPANPDAYLKDLYRNYMDIPPVDKQKVHAIFINSELIENERS